MNKIKKLLVSIAIISSGMILGSLWINPSDNWKIYLPICLIVLSASISLNNNSK